MSNEKTTEENTTKTPESATEHSFKETTEKIWDKTRKTLHSATTMANQYKKIVQKKIDLAAIHKKISYAHADLGKLVDEAREADNKEILATSEVLELFSHLDDLKATAASLLEEIETIKREQDSDSHTK